MRSKSKLIIIGIPVMVLLVCLGAIGITTLIMNSAVGNMIADKFVYSEYNYSYAEEGCYYYNYFVDKEKLKNAFIIIIAAMFAVCLVVTLIFVKIAVRINKKKQIDELLNLLNETIESSDFNESKVSKEYSEIFLKINNVLLKSENYIKEENTKKNELISFLAHDLKTPITIIVGYLNMINELDGMSEEQKNLLISKATLETERLENLIDEFFEITRFNLDSIELDKADTCITYMLQQLGDEFYPMLQEKGITIEIDTKENINALIDADKMARVFSNIIKNAITYAYENTKIKVSISAGKNEIKISISNEGETISKNDLSKLFDKFYRTDKSRNTNTGGAGLGLAIAKEIVLLHEGKISVESEEGLTTFTVIIPA